MTITSAKRRGWMGGKTTLAIVQPDRLRLRGSIGDDNIKIAVAIKISQGQVPAIITAEGRGNRVGHKHAGAADRRGQRSGASGAGAGGYGEETNDKGERQGEGHTP